MSIPYDLLIAFFMFALVSSITPGPNNVMLLASGVNFGFRRSIPHMLGITLGFSLMVLVMGVGLGEVFIKYPIAYEVLRYVSAIYLLYLAWRIVRSGPIDNASAAKKPITFLQAAAFQWVNPKAWVMAIVAVTAYAPRTDFFINVAVLAILYCFFVGPSSMLWTSFGNWFRRYLSSPKHLLIFNITMALLLVASLYPLFME